MSRLLELGSVLAAFVDDSRAGQTLALEDRQGDLRPLLLAMGFRQNGDLFSCTRAQAQKIAAVIGPQLLSRRLVEIDVDKVNRAMQAKYGKDK